MAGKKKTNSQIQWEKHQGEFTQKKTNKQSRKQARTVKECSLKNNIAWDAETNYLQVLSFIELLSKHEFSKMRA